MCQSRCCLVFFFFKQKTAYEMRISYWSSDVCSSDLSVGGAEDRPRARIRIFLTGELFTLKVACGDDPRNGQLTVDQILLDMQRLIETDIAGLGPEVPELVAVLLD